MELPWATEVDVVVAVVPEAVDVEVAEWVPTAVAAAASAGAAMGAAAAVTTAATAANRARGDMLVMLLVWAVVVRAVPGVGRPGPSDGGVG